MMKNPKLAREVIRAAKEGASGLPISVKTRIGYNPPPPKGFGRAGKNDYLLDKEWIKTLLEEDLAALIIHLRTRKEMSDAPAHWELMPRIVAIRNEMSKKTLILGNGDAVDTDDARKKCKKYGCDGVMLGRAIYGNPWLFSHSQEYENVTREQKIQALFEHLALFEELLGTTTNYATMKKHFKAYVSGWDGAKELRIRLMETESITDARHILAETASR